MKEATALVLRVIAERSADLTSKGFHGAELYDQLAIDPEIPENLNPEVVAVLLDVEPETLRDRRKRRAPPSFIRPAQNSVLYPRASFFYFLKSRFVERPNVAAE